MTSMVGKDLWFGVLEAGGKSSPVVRDPSLDTGRAETVYLFNFNRRGILEYQRAIVDGKLRELNGEESELAETLEEAFLDARKGFTPRRAVRPATGSRRRAKAEEDDSDDDTPDFDVDVPLPLDDDDVSLDPVDAEVEEEDDED